MESDIIAMKAIVMTSIAAKQLDDLPPEARDRVIEAITDYAISGRGDVSKLQGRDGYRLRIGDYRVLFDEDAVTILAIQIGRRTTTTYR